MNCSTAEHYSIAYLDGSIDPRRRREMEAHLSECGACRARAQQFREVWSILEETPAVVPSSGFDVLVRARIAQDASRRSLWAWLVSPSPRLAFGVAALMIFSVWLSSLEPAGRASRPVSSDFDAEFNVIADLPVLEDYDVLANFDALSELHMPAAAPQPGVRAR